MSDPPSAPEELPDLFGPTAWHRFYHSRRAILISTIILLTLKLLGQTSQPFSLLMRLFDRARLNDFTFAINPLVASLLTMAALLACIIVALRHSAILPLALGFTLLLSFIDINSTVIDLVSQFIPPPVPSPESHLFGILMMVLMSFATLLIPAALFRLHQFPPQTPPAPGPPPSNTADTAQPFALAYNNPATAGIPPGRTLAIVLLWIIAALNSGGVVLTVFTSLRFSHSSSWIVQIIPALVLELVPALVPAIAALGLRRPTAFKALLIAGWFGGITINYIAAIIGQSALLLRYHQDASSYFITILGISVITTIDVATLHALYRLHRSLTRPI